MIKLLRTCICALGLTMTGLTATPVAASALDAVVRYDSLPETYQFDILRKGNKIGEHRITFQPDATGLTVKVDIDIKVKLGPIPVYRYTHSNTERWENGRLVSIETVTNDNGDNYRVSGRAKGDNFVVSGIEGELTLPGSIIPTSYWQAETVSQSVLLDTQRGVAIDVTTQPKGSDAPNTGTKYAMTGDLELQIWYDGQELEKLAFETDGVLIEYRKVV